MVREFGIRYSGGYSYRRGRFGWNVFNTVDGTLVGVGIPTRLRAMYVCAVLNRTPGIESYFKFGGI